MKLEIVPLKKEHIEEIQPEGSPSGLTIDELFAAYTLPGSVAQCALVDGKPVAAGGIINFIWNRGEAWLLIGPDARKHFVPILRAVRKLLPEHAKTLNFHRVQATSYWNESRKLLTMLGFTPEGTLQAYGPQGESAVMYARLFQ